MKFLILGGHGFIGHTLARQLKEDNHDINIVDCHHNYGEYQPWEHEPVLTQRIKYMGDHSFYEGSVTDEKWLESVFEEVKPNIVIDLATYPNAKMVKKNIVDATENMITATALALNLSAKYKVNRFVLASSSMVYGNFDVFDGPPNENDICNPLTLYGSYKLQCEKMCQIWYKEHGLEYSILRPSALYGVRDMVVRVISIMTVSALKNKKIIVNGADNKLDFSNVEDVASAFKWASIHPNCVNRIFNCTRGNGRKIIEAAELINSYIPSTIELQSHDDFYPNRDTLNSNLLKELTPWLPSTDIETGIPEYLDWFMKQNYLNRF
jgi:UDP-glucose 4-epimerase